MQRTPLLLPLIALLLFAACNGDDDSAVAEDFVVAFESPSIGLLPEEESKEITLIFSRAATENGSLTLSVSSQTALYDTDYFLEPSPVSDILEIPIQSGMTRTSFRFHKLQNPAEGTESSVQFEITAVNLSNGYTQGNTDTTVSLTESASLGGGMQPEVGGPNQPNQVYVDLSTRRQTTVRRTAWDLGFHSGDTYRVVLNGSVYMAAAPLSTTDIDQVSPADVSALQAQVAVGTFDPTNMAYVDRPDGDLSGTALAEIAENEAENPVYLLNMGYAIGTETPNPGSVAVAGEHRGWMKIRVLRSSGGYTLQYAPLEANTHQSVEIAKEVAYNFSFFSLVNNSTVAVEPEKEAWDLNFTVFTNEIEGNGSYGYADFVAANRKAGVTGYVVNSELIAYTGFSAADIQGNLLDADQRFIGSRWRVGGGPDSLPTLNESVFFVVKDPAGNVYKLRFTALLSEDGVRGYPAFEYALL